MNGFSLPLNSWQTLVSPFLTPPGTLPAQGIYRPSQWNDLGQLVSLTVTLPGKPTQAVSSTILDPTTLQPVESTPAPTVTPGSPGTSTTYYFDAVLHIEHDQQLRRTSHPIQTGASITDHAYLEVATIVLDVLMSDAADRVVSGQFTSATSKSVSAYQTMKYIQKLRIPIFLATRLDSYDNCLIEDVRAADTPKTVRGSRFILRIGQIKTASTATKTVSARPDQTDSSPSGQKTTSQLPPDVQSLLNGMGTMGNPFQAQQ